MSADRVLIVAGEASGDLHGARLLSELRLIRPEVEAFGLGGDELQAAGLDSVAHSREIAVVGITEVLSVLGRARELFRDLLQLADDRKPDVAVLIDSPEFNLRLAKGLSERGVRVVYYISPQIWAWRKGRVKTIAKSVDRMLVLFPFETEFYEEHEIDAVHVGHPLVDEVPELPHVWETNPDPECWRIALLPGSRKSELNRLLPLLFESAAEIQKQRSVEFLVIAAPTVDPGVFSEAGEKYGLEISIVTENRYEALSRCHLALCASGTAALEVGLVGTPLIVVYRVGAGSAFLGKLLVDLPFLSLVNLVSGREIVPELYQENATVPRVVTEAVRWIDDREGVAQMRSDLGELRGLLGASGASRRAAEQVADMLNTAAGARN